MKNIRKGLILAYIICILLFIVFREQIFTASIAFQRTFIQIASENFGQTTSMPLSVALGLMLLSFSYGFIHTLAPGHGKAIYSSYLAGVETNYALLLRLSLILTITHAGSSLVMAILFKTILTGIKYFDRISIVNHFYQVSGFLVIVLALYIVYTDFFKKKNHNHHHAREVEKVGLSAGGVPCPIMLSLLFLSISLNAFWLGLLIVFSMALGIFTFIFLLGIFIHHFKGSLQFNTTKFAYINTIMRILSIILLLAIGIKLLTGTYLFL